MTIPVHVAIIPDGNRRWARKRGMPDMEGHRVSAEKVLPAIIENLNTAGVKYFTFWALSTENAKKRSKEEYNNLLGLMKFFLQRRVDRLYKKNVRIKIIGDVHSFPADIQKLVAQAMDMTKDNTAITVIFGINYGGRDEIIRGVKKAAAEGKIDGLSIANFGEFLDTKDIPDPDLIIRTGGEKRISGFMLWQSEYAEYFFTDKLFPEFSQEDIDESFKAFNATERRFGK
jgi:undecaprenyl diphosphate synthase